MNTIYIFSNVAANRTVRTDLGDILVFLNKAVTAPLYRDVPAARKILFRRRGLDTFGRELDWCENINIETGGIPKSFIRELERSYDWDYDSLDSAWRGMTTGYIVTKYLQKLFTSWKIVLVNFGYEVKTSTPRRKDHNWRFEADQLSEFEHIFTANLKPGTEKRRIFYITGGHLGDSVYASAVVENILATGKFEINVGQTYPGVWDNCPKLNRGITRKDADFVLRNEYLAKWENGCPSIIEGVLRVAEQKLGIDIPLKFTKPLIYAPLQPALLGVPYIVVCSGFLPSCPLKNWGRANWEKLVTLFPGTAIVQVGNAAGNSEPLPGCMNMIDRTDFPTLCCLIRNARCVIAPVNGLVHIAAALERPFVAIAGGREPASLLGYPSGTVLDVCGQLDCCRRGGCRRCSLEKCSCLDGEIPRCMAMITPETVSDTAKALMK